MKNTYFILLLLTLNIANGQNPQALLDSAKTLFKAEEELSTGEYKEINYQQIAEILETVTELEPNNSEARYYLGYAYSRINSTDGRGMVDMNLDLLLKTSKQFEKVIELSPKYDGEVLILSPYTKLSSEWGSMAMSYWHNSKPDSAIWAFSEGKKRGGFSDFTLEMSREALDACSKNSILFTSGDIISIPLWYLQIVENYRTDVSLVDINLLNSNWYPLFLSENNIVDFGISNEKINDLSIKEWEDSIFTIGKFSWKVEPNYNEQHMLSGGIVFLSLLRENKFERDIFFTIGFTEESRLNLGSFMSSRIIIDELTVFGNEELSFKEYKKTITKALKLVNHTNVNNPDEIRVFGNFRLNILFKAYHFIEEGDFSKARELMEILDEQVDIEKYPYYTERVKEYYQFIRKYL